MLPVLTVYILILKRNAAINTSANIDMTAVRKVEKNELSIPIKPSFDFFFAVFVLLMP